VASIVSVSGGSAVGGSASAGLVLSAGDGSRYDLASSLCRLPAGGRIEKAGPARR